MDSKITQACLGILKREDVKNELKNLMSPLVDMILVDIYPYIYLSLIFVCISFPTFRFLFYCCVANLDILKLCTFYYSI